MVGHASAERGRERHPSRTSPGTDRLHAHAQTSQLQQTPSLLTTRSPAPASPPRALTQTLAETHAGQGQSSLCTSPTTFTSPPSSCIPMQASAPSPGNPWVRWGAGRELSAQAGLGTLEVVSTSLGACRLTQSGAGLTLPDEDLWGFFCLF